MARRQPALGSDQRRSIAQQPIKHPRLLRHSGLKDSIATGRQYPEACRHKVPFANWGRPQQRLAPAERHNVDGTRVDGDVARHRRPRHAGRGAATSGGTTGWYGRVHWTPDQAASVGSVVVHSVAVTPAVTRGLTASHVWRRMASRLSMRWGATQSAGVVTAP